MADFVLCVDLHGKKYKVSKAKLKWRPSVYGIIIKDHKVLLSPQYEDNCYDLPGGGIEVGESPKQALRREVKEETGIVVKRPRLLGVDTSYYKPLDKKNQFWQTLLLYYWCDYARGEISTAGFDRYERQYARIAEWFPISELSSIKVASTRDFREYVMKAYRQEP